MHTIQKTIAAAGIAACSALATLPVQAQQFTMKLSQPTINDVTHEYFKRMKAGIERRRISARVLRSWRTRGHCPWIWGRVRLGSAA